jgi:hypothetical protein
MRLRHLLVWISILGALFAISASLTTGQAPASSATAEPDQKVVNAINDGHRTPVEQPLELGEVQWRRDWSVAQSESAKSKKPILILFQEVPGCQTCRDFGSGPLSDPLLVEAIEDLFVPFLVYNNKPGRDAELLERFSEPSWNNPVVRYVSAGGDDLVSRKEGIWTSAAMADRMIAALTAAESPVPSYLRSIDVQNFKGLETSEFAMHCFWEGEAKLGAIDGVYSTRSGWRENREVVRVEFDPAKVNYEQLVLSAKSLKCALTIFAHSGEQRTIASRLVGEADVESVDTEMRDAKDSDQKYYLRQSHFRHLPLTEIQAAKINARLATHKNADDLLSPRQREILADIKRVVALESDALNSFVFPAESELSQYRQRLLAKLQSY